MPAPYTEWTDGLIRQLLDLSAEGLTRSQIGDRMGLSKGAVCGCVTRLKAKGLTVASNPPKARHHMRSMPPPPPPAPAVTLPSLAAVVEVPTVSSETPTATVTEPPVTHGRYYSAPPPKHPGRSECAFIFGDRPHYRFCGAPCVPNARGMPSPYCREHLKLCTSGVQALRSVAA